MVGILPFINRVHNKNNMIEIRTDNEALINFMYHYIEKVMQSDETYYLHLEVSKKPNSLIINNYHIEEKKNVDNKN